MARVITVSGGKGGVGKTNLSVNLALALAQRGARVCLFDADLGLANVNILLGLYPEYDLEDVIVSDKTVADILIRDYHGIDIIPGSTGVERLANLEQDSVNRIIDSFAELSEYDYFIVDTAAGISRSVVSFCLAASDIIVVITSEPTSLTDAYALLKVLAANRFSGTAKVVVNQCPTTAVASRTYTKLRDVAHKYLSLELVPLGIIVHDKKVVEAIHRQQPLITLFPQSSAAKCVQVLATRLVENEPEDFTSPPISSFWRRVLEIARGPIKIPEKGGTSPSMPDQPAEVPAAKAFGAGSSSGQRRASNPSVELAAAQRPAEDAAPPAGRPLLADMRMVPASGERSENPVSVFDRIDLAHLPTLPHILLKLIEACGSDDASMADLAAIVEKDPSLCAKILRMVNSVYYGFSRTITSFSQALALLGIDTIRSIALSASICQAFNGMTRHANFNIKQFWWHSLMSAVLAQLLAKKTGYPRPEEAFLSGLLHDIGKLVLLQHDPDRYAEVVRQSARDGQAIAHERQLLGTDHCESGAWLIQHWQLQLFIADAVRYHHEPVARIANALPLVKIAYAANALCAQGPLEQKDRLRVACDVLGLEADAVETAAEEAGEQVDRIADSLDIDIEHPHEGFGERDEEARACLNSQVRDISLLQGTLQSFLHARDIPAIVAAARSGFQMLFDAGPPLVFLHDASRKMLTAHDDRLGELVIPGSEGTSLIAAALDQARVADTFAHGAQHALTIIDEQLIRHLGREGLMCFPMVVRGQPVGALVIGLSRDRAAFFNSRLRLAGMFVNHAALALDAELSRQAQARRVLEERLAASRAIAHKVAHEVNNPLSIIKNYLKIMEISLAEQKQPCEEIAVIQSEIDRVAAIVDELSDFSRPRASVREILDINSLLQDMLKLIAGPFKQQGIDIVLNLDENLPRITSGAQALKQVFMNLLKNAGEALSDGGTIRIATCRRSDGDAVEMSISDDGPGMSELMQTRLFEPYTSTKGRNHAGLGLSVVYGIIKELNGTITCTSREGQGTQFTIMLPCA